MQFIDLYNKLVYERNDDGSFVRVAVDNVERNSYNSLRVQLVRKFNQQVKDEEAFEIDTHSGLYMACSFQPCARGSAVGTATFCLKEVDDAPRKKKVYNITVL
jgi:hypothetical protein